MLQELALATNGFVGADLGSLCREAALHALRRRVSVLKDHSLSDVSSSVDVIMDDFLYAFRHMGSPSLTRGENFMTIGGISWDDIGGLVDVKNVAKAKL
jgi:transitional endoplasmic reticulum ATPase